ncbi:hypothetical protein HRbin36_02372 [bacterium HR36]|nr:hypothetical protein HRbin36_02372 [bacterium HR36]
MGFEACGFGFQRKLSRGWTNIRHAPFYVILAIAAIDHSFIRRSKWALALTRTLGFDQLQTRYLPELARVGLQVVEEFFELLPAGESLPGILWTPRRTSRQ